MTHSYSIWQRTNFSKVFIDASDIIEASGGGCGDGACGERGCVCAREREREREGEEERGGEKRAGLSSLNPFRPSVSKMERKWNL